MIWAVHSGTWLDLGYAGTCMNALTWLRNRSQNVFDRGSRPQLRWICSAADSRNLLGLGSSQVQAKWATWEILYAVLLVASLSHTPQRKVPHVAPRAVWRALLIKESMRAHSAFLLRIQYLVTGQINLNFSRCPNIQPVAHKHGIGELSAHNNPQTGNAGPLSRFFFLTCKGLI